MDGVHFIDDDIKQDELLDKGQYLLKSCDLNYGDGCWLFAKLLVFIEFSNLLSTSVQDDYQDINKILIDKINKNDLGTLHYIKKPCDLNSANGCEALGDSYYFGDGVKRDEKLSFFIAKRL